MRCHRHGGPGGYRSENAPECPDCANERMADSDRDQARKAAEESKRLSAARHREQLAALKALNGPPVAERSADTYRRFLEAAARFLNVGLLENAEAQLEQAKKCPDADAGIVDLQALLAEKRGNSAEAARLRVAAAGLEPRIERLLAAAPHAPPELRQALLDQAFSLGDPTIDERACALRLEAGSTADAARVTRWIGQVTLTDLRRLRGLLAGASPLAAEEIDRAASRMEETERQREAERLRERGRQLESLRAAASAEAAAAARRATADAASAAKRDRLAEEAQRARAFEREHEETLARMAREQQASARARNRVLAGGVVVFAAVAVAALAVRSHARLSDAEISGMTADMLRTYRGRLSNTDGHPPRSVDPGLEDFGEFEQPDRAGFERMRGCLDDGRSLVIYSWAAPSWWQSPGMHLYCRRSSLAAPTLAQPPEPALPSTRVPPAASSASEVSLRVDSHAAAGVTFEVHAGERIEVKASGRASTHPGGTVADCDIEAGPEGLPRCSYVRSHTELRGFPFMGLLAEVDGKWTFVGDNATLTPKRDGEVRLKVNDWDPRDSRGVFTVILRRVGAPDAVP